MGNNISSVSLLASNMAMQSSNLDAGMAVLKKSNDIAKQEGAGIIQLMEDSLPQTDGHQLDVYA
jgi:hypothetical protein